MHQTQYKAVMQNPDNRTKKEKTKRASKDPLSEQTTFDEGGKIELKIPFKDEDGDDSFVPKRSEVKEEDEDDSPTCFLPSIIQSLSKWSNKDEELKD